jgi:hypothetical protein
MILEAKYSGAISGSPSSRIRSTLTRVLQFLWRFENVWIKKWWGFEWKRFQIRVKYFCHKCKHATVNVVCFERLNRALQQHPGKMWWMATTSMDFAVGESNSCAAVV